MTPDNNIYVYSKFMSSQTFNSSGSGVQQGNGNIMYVGGKSSVDTQVPLNSTPQNNTQTFYNSNKLNVQQGNGNIMHIKK